METLAGKTRAAALASILNAKDSNGESLLESAYEASQNSAGAAAEAMETAMSSIESKIALFQQATTTMWQNTISSDFIKGLVDVGTAIVTITDKAGLLKVVLSSTVGILAAKSGINIFSVAKNDAVAANEKILLLNHTLKEYQNAFRSNGLSGIKNVLTSKEGFKPAVTQADVAIIDQYNNAVSNGTASQVNWNIAASSGSNAVKQLVTGAQGAIITQEQYIVATEGSTAAMIGAKAAAFALNAALTMGLSIAIQAVIGLFDKLIPTSKEIEQSANDLISKYSSVSSEINNGKKAIDDSISSYEELSKGVDGLGNNVSLTTEEFKEYNSICEQIANTYPDLVEGWTNEGNAILKCKDNVALLTEEYKKARKEAANFLIFGDPNDKKAGNGDDIVKNYHNKMDNSLPERIFLNNRPSLSSKKDALDKVLDINSVKELDEYLNLLKGTNVGLYGYLHDIGYAANMSSEEFVKFHSNVKNALTGIDKASKENLSAMKELANAYLTLDGDGISDEYKAIVSNIISDMTNEIADGLDTKEDVQEWVDNIINTIDDATPEMQENIANLLSPPEDMTKEQYAALFATVQEYLDKNNINVPLNFVVRPEDFEEATKELPKVQTTVAGKASDVKNYISTQKATVAGSNSEQTLDTIFNNYESEINKLSDYLAKAVNNGLSNSDYVALSTDFGIVASSAKEAEEAIREVMDASESSTIEVLDEAIKNASETGREDLVPALEGIKDRLAEVNDEAQKLSDGNSGFAKAMSSMAEGFDALDKIYSDVKNGKDKNKSSENNGAYFDFSSLVDSNFVDQFQECGDAYQNFLDVVMRTPDDINACQSAFDDLATKYVLQRAGIEDLVDAQGNINEAMKQTTITQLKNWGILNAKELVDNECAAAALYHKSAIDELNVSSDASVGVLANEASALLNESNASGVTKTALFDLISTQKIFNNTNLDTSGKIKALRDLAVAFGLTTEQAQNAANKVDMNKAIAEAQKKSIAENHRLLNNSEMDAIRNQYLSSAKSSISGSIAAEFGKLTGKYGGGQTSNKVGSSGGGGSGSSTTTTVTKDYINWAENSIDNLTNKIERLQSLIADTTSYSKKIKYLKEIYSYQKKLVNIESKNVTATKKQYNKMLNNLSGSQKKKYKKLIESTTAVSYEQFVSTTTTGGKKKSGNKTVNKETKTLYEAVSNAQSAWKEYQDALGSYKEKNTQLIQHQIDIYEAELDYMDQKISVYEERIERAQSRIDDIDSEKVLKDVKKGNKLFSKKKPSSKTVKKYAEEYGMSANRYKKLFKNKNNTDEYKAGVLQGAYNAKQYKIEASNYKNIINLQNSKADKLIKERKLVGTTTEKYKELSEEIAKAQAEAMKASEELEEKLYNIANAEFSAIQNAYKTTSERTSGRADAIQSRIDYKINNGGEVSKTDYEKVISLRKDDENKALKERLDLERKLTETRNKLKKLNKSDKNYKQNLAALTRAEKDQTLAVYESVSAYYQKKEATRAAQLQMIKAPLVNLERELKLIQAQIAELEKLKQKYTDSIGVVNYYLGEQIENLNKQKDNINAYYDSIIDPLQKQLDLLSKVNEQRDRALALEKAQYELEKAKSQKTQKVLRNGNWQWEADQESVRDAQKNLDDAKYNKITGEIKDTIDELTRARDEQIKAYDKEIERISTIQSEWSKAVERAEYMSKIDVFESTFGKGSLQKILNGDGSILDQVVNRLQDVQLNLDSLDIDQERIEGQIQSVNDLVTAFETGKQTFEEAEKYIDGASDSLKELESDAAQNVPTVIETMGELSTSIGDITKKCKSLSSKYKKTMKNISSSTEGTSGTAKQLSKLSTSLNKVKKQIDKINPVTGATAEQLSSIKDSIVETGKVLTDLSDGYLKDANDLFIRLADEGVQKSYEKFAKIGKYITDNLIPRVSSLCSSIQTLSNKYSTSADRIGDAQSETNDFNIACKNVINSLKTLRSQNIQAAQSYNQLATAANKAATAANKAANAIDKQNSASSKSSSSKSSSSKSSSSKSSSSKSSSKSSGSSHAEGTRNANTGTSLVGETATELVWHKKKKTYQLVSEPSLVKLDAGDVVFNGEETKSIMKNGAMSTIKDIKGLQSKMLKSSYSSNISNTPSNNSNMNETIIHIDRVELPNIKSGDDAQRLVDALCNLDGTVTQKLHSN